MNILRIPTLADVHVHLREPGGTQKEDFNSGTKAAIAGGYTQILDMPNNTPPTVSPSDIATKEKLAKGRIWCDVGFNFGASKESTKYFDKVQKKVFALKVYMNQTTGSLLIGTKTERELIFSKWERGLPIMVHAEGETVETAISLAKKYNRKLHVCHVTAEQVQVIKKAKNAGISISCEVCPHHLFLSRKDISKLGNFAIMKPPLLSEKDREKLWDAMADIDMISTDHAPHTTGEKMDQSSPKYGVPGLETTLPLMLWAADRRLITVDQITKLLSTNPKKIFHLPHQSDTYLVIDISAKYKISQIPLFTKCNWTPFGDHDGVGKIKKVVLRGETVFENGNFIGKPNGVVMYKK